MLGFILWWLERQNRKNSSRIIQEQIDDIIRLTDKLGVLDSKMRSNAVRYGQKFEQLIPLAKNFNYNLKDVKFLGSPIDMIVFDGLDDGEVKEIVFLEVKTGTSKLSTRQRKVRDCIVNKKVKFKVIRDE